MDSLFSQLNVDTPESLINTFIKMRPFALRKMMLKSIEMCKHLSEPYTYENTNLSKIHIKEISKLYFKFGDMHKITYNYKNLAQKNTCLLDYNKASYARISQLIHYYDLYLLHSTLRQDNTLIYLPFQFDFRGRCYQSSPIGVTTSKYMRFVYNYGVYGVNEISKQITSDKILSIVSKRIRYIKTIKEKYAIKRSENRVNVAIF